jgi:tRNA pseudouridine55 synthase
VLVDKPVGPTSHDVVAAVRRAHGIKRVGHTGTLDPFASGLLFVFLGQGTRLTRFMAPLHKTYTGVIRLGVETDTLDSTGGVVSESEVTLPLQTRMIEEAFATFLGRQQQVPPIFSAKKVNGVPAHRRVRRGEEVKLEPATVEIFSFELTAVDGADVSFVAEVGTGTYIRALARDVGRKLGVGGHLTALRRTKIGDFRVDDAFAMDQLTESRKGELADAVAHLPAVAIDEEQKSAVLNGKQVAGTAGGDDALQDDTEVALTYDGSLVAIAEASGGVLQPRVVVVAG